MTLFAVVIINKSSLKQHQNKPDTSEPRRNERNMNEKVCLWVFFYILLLNSADSNLRLSAMNTCSALPWMIAPSYYFVLDKYKKREVCFTLKIEKCVVQYASVL